MIADRLPQETQRANSQVSEKPILLTGGGGNFDSDPPSAPLCLRGSAPFLQTLLLNPNHRVRWYVYNYFFSCYAQGPPRYRIKVTKIDGSGSQLQDLYIFSSLHVLYSDMLIRFRIFNIHPGVMDLRVRVTSLCLLLFNISFLVLGKKKTCISF